MKKKINKFNIAIIGIGYVGLPLAVEFGKKYLTTGYDINKNRINELNNYKDSTLTISSKEIKNANLLKFTDNLNDITKCNFFIITVPTPVDKNNKPDLSSLNQASIKVGKLLKKNDIVVYESTVYPGVTEEYCVPILEKNSKLKYNKDFFVGYSPERINPGDKINSLKNICKITSGSNIKTANIIDKLYSSILKKGTFKAKTIKIAEAAKVIENAQRDINIAFMNELSMIFSIMKIDTKEVLDAAETKWNFLPFKPGLVGGHCVAVDPYYLTHRAKILGYNPKIIPAGRKINEAMGKHIVRQLIRFMKNIKINISNKKILVLGFTFKENCPDVRNTRVYGLIKELQNLKFHVDVYDPYITPKTKDIIKYKDINFIYKINNNTYDVIILAVGHKGFKKLGFVKIKSFGKKTHLIYDLKYIFPKEIVDIRL